MYTPGPAIKRATSSLCLEQKEQCKSCVFCAIDKLKSILKEHTGQSMKTIQKDTDRDNFMSASESAKYGLIDKVLTKR